MDGSIVGNGARLSSKRLKNSAQAHDAAASCRYSEVENACVLEATDCCKGGEVNDLRHFESAARVAGLR